MKPVPVMEIVVWGPEEHPDAVSPLAVMKSGESDVIVGVGLFWFAVLLLEQLASTTIVPATSDIHADRETIKSFSSILLAGPKAVYTGWGQTKAKETERTGSKSLKTLNKN
jgi:hypothetical protein